MKKCHLNILNNVTNWAELLHHYYRSHQIHYTLMFVCLGMWNARLVSFLYFTSFAVRLMFSIINNTLVVFISLEQRIWRPQALHSFQGSSLLASLTLSLLQSTGSVSTWGRVPSWRAALPPCTSATICWSWPEASPLSPSATGSCRPCVDTERCQMASFLRGGLAVDTVSNSWTESHFFFLMFVFRHFSLQLNWTTAEH